MPTYLHFLVSINISFIHSIYINVIEGNIVHAYFPECKITTFDQYRLMLGNGKHACKDEDYRNIYDWIISIIKPNRDSRKKELICNQ